MARRLEEDAGFSAYLASIQQFHPLEREEELRLARRWRRRHDREAADTLVRANLRFVVKIAMQYRGYGLRVSDLVEEGNIGLCEAVKRFDPSRNLRFMTYAAYWIRAYVLAHVLKQWSMVGVGTGPLQSKLFFRMARERARITTALGAEGTPSLVEEKLAVKFGTSVERIRDMTGRLEAKDSSLDAAAWKEGSETQLDRLADDRGEGQEASFERMQRDSIVRDRVSGISRTLSPRERYILARRLLCDEQETLAEIGRHLNLSRERVRQIEDRLKLKLRRALTEFEPQQLRA
jgi:RNA polymerase sigma-32 factor